MSKEDRTFEEDEIPCLYMIARDTSHLYNSIGMSFVFDDVDNNYPTKLRIVTYDGDTKKQDFEVENQSGISFVMDTSLDDYNKVYIYFLETKNPYRRIILNQIIWGLLKTFTSKDILKVEGRDFSDPLSRELSSRELSITVDNMNLSYNQDNPSGINRYFQERQQLKVQFKDQMLDGTTETIDYGTYLLDGRPTTDKREATFNSFGYYNYNNNTNFYKQVHSDTPLSFKSIATDIFEDMVLPLDNEMNKMYYIDDSLDDMYCNVPLPLDTHAELLKLIAQACFCTIREDNNGVIRIEPLDYSLEDLYIDFKNQSEEPSGETSELINEIKVKKYSYTIDTSSSEIYSGDITINGEQELHIEYQNTAKDVVPTLPQGVTLVSGTYYVNACDLVVTSDSEITGKLVLMVKQLILMAHQQFLNIQNIQMVQVEKLTMF